MTLSLSSQWLPEIAYHCPGTPFLLVGTKVDLRDDRYTLEMLGKKYEQVVTFKDGEEVARHLKAVKYVECSALTQVQKEKKSAGVCFLTTKWITIDIAGF